MNNTSPYLTVDAIPVSQPFGEFYICKIKALILLNIAFTDPIRYEDDSLKGTQRELDEKIRVRDIKEYVEGSEAAFPNTIILSANYDEDGFNVSDTNIKWRFESGKLIIPTNKKLASIIDGQHRLYGFEKANQQAQSMELVCSIYLDLPNPLQAFLFATINSNQKPVSKSLAYAQFGFNVDDEDAPSWSPDKLSIALHNKFNREVGSAFYRHIKLAPQIDELLRKEIADSKWVVSTATVVDGIIRLISTNPKRDRYKLQKLPLDKRQRNSLEMDNSPLRWLYLNVQDIVIYKIVDNYFRAANDKLFAHSHPNSSIIKTVGIQGLFDVLRQLLVKDAENDVTLKSIDLKKERFYSIFDKVFHVDFSDDLYQYSAVGRANIADTILYANGYISVPEITNDMTDSQKSRALQKIERLKRLQIVIDKLK